VSESTADAPPLTAGAVLDGLTAAYLLVDRQGRVTHANDAARRFFREHEAAFRATCPEIEPDRLVDLPVGRLHPRLADSRLWSDTDRRPARLELTVGTAPIEVELTAVRDEQGHPVVTGVRWHDQTAEREREAEEAARASQITAIRRSQAVIEFDLDGTIRDANENFLAVVGYSLDEVVGRHHSMFVPPAQRETQAYRDFWARLRRGEFESGEFPRVGKGGREVWIQATYNPVLDVDGKPVRVIKYAMDVTEQRLRQADFESQVAAIGKSQAVIEFEMDGTIRTANDNFLRLVGYELSEVQGRHHRIFVDAEEQRRPEYAEFWARLNRGEYDAGTYRRVGKGGGELWIQASYNPVLDPAGRPYKVVKFAADITDRMRIAALMDETIRVTHALGASDLTQRVEGDYTGRFAEFQTAFNDFIESMGTTILQTKTAGIAVGEAMVQLRRSSEQLAQGAAEQQRACQVSAEALTETTTMVQATSANAGRANELVQTTADAANVGSSKMEGLTRAMADISASSSEITKIIKVIDEIAFQTNLLAVNAAVEAARAGRRGRGFAVVAQEVRSLAGRSAKAAQATAELIEQSAKTEERGVEEVSTTATSLEAILANVMEVRDIVGEISAASEEQSRGVSGVRQSMEEINTSAASAAQQSAELAASATSLTQQADVLREAVGRFRVAEGTAGVDGPIDDQVLGQIASLLGIPPGALASLRQVAPQGEQTPAEVAAGPRPGRLDDHRGYDDF